MVAAYTLCLHTADFPYGCGEQFIETEIKYLAQAFQRVVVIPASARGTQRPVPENVEILQPSYDGYSTFRGMKKSGKWLLNFLPDIFKHPDRKFMLSLVLRAGFQACRLLLFLQQNGLIDNTLHYTYWFDSQSTLLSILKAKGIIKGYISRAHGFDLYAERRKDGFIPFRLFQLKHVTRLYIISQNGLNYMKSHYPEYSGKYRLSYLGIDNNRPLQYIPLQKTARLIVSCSRMVDIKRIDKIIETLALIKDIPIKWVHFGDGPLFSELTELLKILPVNIEVKFKGHVDNMAIYDFYKDNHVDCFVNLSSSEGLPVTVMEAISFGIPAVATNVGGTSEIVTDSTGILLKNEFETEDVKNAVMDILLNKSSNIEFRKGVYEFWKQYFNAEKNYSEFTAEINEIIN
ncbi:MAG: glycosyltransferase [Bacteroidales bacterium]|jgi:glycosyltransferase involved in cell wall biosynthesis|nr:glycosyltransferase [Bacteroidales bacterium]